MSYRVEYRKEADIEISTLKRSDIQAYKKLLKLIKELHEHPHTGTGKPEQMKYGRWIGLWSRRVTGKHRLVYSINDSEIVVLVVSVKGHYDDK
jgi:toxin YoeB